MSTGVGLDKVGMLGKIFHPSKKNKKNVDKVKPTCYNNYRNKERYGK